MRALLSLLVIAAVLAGSPLIAPAMETDQYNLPPVPLADIGDEVSTYIEQNVSAAVEAVNDRIDEHEACLAASIRKGCGARADEEKSLGYLRTNAAIAKAVYERLGSGSLFITKTGKWFNSHHFAHTPDRYKVAYSDSVYIFMPIDYATMSPTVRMYGVELGTDKIEHFFQQGYKYYTIRRDEMAKGKDPADAERAAVRWGRLSENTFFGLMVAGVYSNGDLYANYAGMKFFEGLTAPIEINGTTRPAVFSLKGGRWATAADRTLHDALIKPFISNGLNEALNPSVYALNVYPTVKRVVHNQSCIGWRARYPSMTSEAMQQQTAEWNTWYGENYGRKKGDLMVPIASCFEPTASQAVR